MACPSCGTRRRRTSWLDWHSAGTRAGHGHIAALPHRIHRSSFAASSAVRVLFAASSGIVGEGDSRQQSIHAVDQIYTTYVCRPRVANAIQLIQVSPQPPSAIRADLIPDSTVAPIKPPKHETQGPYTARPLYASDTGHKAPNKRPAFKPIFKLHQLYAGPLLSRPLPERLRNEFPPRGVSSMGLVTRREPSSTVRSATVAPAA